MNKWLNIEKGRRVAILENISKQTGLSGLSVEKDWWVTMALKALFSSPFSKHLLFKGGTSLSKCWRLIERFSEDLDIAIDREYLGFGGELSKNQISDKLRRASCSFTRGILSEELRNQLLLLGIDEALFSINVNVSKITTKDPETIEIYYKSDYAQDSYIPKRVLIEVSGRSMREPMERVHINSIISNMYPTASFADNSFEINAVSPKRTFLEKAFLLHEEFHKSISEIRADRMSRHLYDLEKLSETRIAKEALADMELYRSIVEHRKKFIGLKGFDYSTLNPDSISFIPPDNVLAKWKEDYEKMQSSMIYGSSLSFEELIERIKELNNQFKLSLNSFS